MEEQNAIEESWEDLPLFADEGNLKKVAKDEQVPEDMSDSFAMLSHLVYDEDTPAEVSDQLREKGNSQFKIGTKYSLKRAVEHYTKALELDDLEPEVKSLAYLNRAAAEMKLENFGKALADAKMAISLDSSNGKAYWRAAKAANSVGRWQEARDLASSGIILAREGSASIPLLKSEVEVAKKNLARDLEKVAAVQKKEEEKDNRVKQLSKILVERGLQIGPPLFSQQLKYSTQEPKINSDGSLSYPVLIVYPSYSGGDSDQVVQSDFIEDFHEMQALSDFLQVMLPPPWDQSGELLPGRVDALYREKWTISPREMEERIGLGEDLDEYLGSTRGRDELGSWKSVSVDKPLFEILALADYITPKFPVFYIVPKGYRPP
uniref:Cns1/TTC4 wheel domain-containing protein n=2 Tax=Rhodosorus marinus TaxID=101924 RepID=A0A7S3EE12_9RHOD|mmetsp:Transcript_29079/g.113056  ORF Transcript_29079/g.113056 Transcript_29079/m.113056 type:complete len:377 (+) Transcript_29079:113-1243(+)